ncbi:MAG: EamA family transporter [Solirubrobacteraceae bacterium]
MIALTLALSSSVCWGVSDFVGGLQARRVPLLWLILVSQSVGLACVIVVLAARGQGTPELTRMLPAAAAGLGGVVALSAFYRALAIGTMSIVAPISATGAAIPVIVGLASGDRPAVVQLVGILAALVGVVLASREPGEEPRQRRAARTSVALSLVAAAGFGAFFVGIRASSQADVPWALFASRAAGVAGLLVALALQTGLARHRGRPPAALPRGRSVLGALVAVGLLDVSANALYALASRRGLLSVVAVASSLYPLATVVLARWLLGERVRRVQEAGIVAALAGVLLIAAG